MLGIRANALTMVFRAFGGRSAFYVGVLADCLQVAGKALMLRIRFSGGMSFRESSDGMIAIAPAGRLRVIMVGAGMERREICTYVWQEIHCQQNGYRNSGPCSHSLPRLLDSICLPSLRSF
jgi:hypothetical protein